ncbi:MAG: metallophosphatase domain-containing protein [Chitinophagaceae bacterium]
MKFVAISDTHCRHKSLKLPKGDVLLHAGDVTYKGERWEVMDFLDWFGKQNYTYKIFIAGNHDFYFEKISSAAMQAVLPKEVIYLNDSGITINNINVWGTPVTPWYYNWAFNRPRGTAINRHWQLIPADTDVLITHGPPYGLLDTVINGRNTGDKDLRKRVEALKPKVHLFGHIHESYGVEKRGETKFINATVLNESYELVNPPVVFEL